MKLKAAIWIFLFYAILAFPSFYFVYKFGDPTDVAHDFFQYYRLYYNWDWSNVNAPFNMRLVSSGGIFLLHKTGFYYNTASAFDKYLPYGFDKSVFFSAVFFNYISVALTSLVISRIVFQRIKNLLFSLFSGAVYLLGSGILFHEIMPCADAFSTLVFAIGLYYYNNKSPLVHAALVASILQREYILLAFALLALFDFLFRREKFFLYVLATAFFGFVVYFILRKTFFYTPVLSFQTSAASLMEGLMQPGIDVIVYLRQLLLSLNLFLLYVALVIYKKLKEQEFDKEMLLKNMFLLMQIILVSFAAALGTNTGRYLFIASPFLIYCLACEARALFGVGNLAESR